MSDSLSHYEYRQLLYSVPWSGPIAGDKVACRHTQTAIRITDAVLSHACALSLLLQTSLRHHQLL